MMRLNKFKYYFVKLMTEPMINIVTIRFITACDRVTHCIMDIFF